MNTKKLIRAILIPPAVLVFMVGVLALVQKIPTEYLSHTAALTVWVIVSIIIYKNWK